LLTLKLNLELEGKLGGADSSVRALLDQFRVLINSGYTNFESLGTIEPLQALLKDLFMLDLLPSLQEVTCQTSTHFQ
jgi:hypothetical protein